MKKAEIEQLIAALIRKAVEATAAECVRQINQAGHSFVAADDCPLQWVDEGSNDVLEVTCALGVGMSKRSTHMRIPDPDIAAFLALAESGTDQVATTLNLLEGDIANGGFSQLFDNKGAAFIREAMGYLQDIGALSAARLVREALALVDDYAATIHDYNRLQRDFRRLDARYNRLKINIPELYARLPSRTKPSRRRRTKTRRD